MREPIGIDFEWDPAKDEANQRKHGVDFETARLCWLDECCFISEDTANSNHEEQRWVLFGKLPSGKVLLPHYQCI